MSNEMCMRHVLKAVTKTRPIVFRPRDMIAAESQARVHEGAQEAWGCGREEGHRVVVDGDCPEDCALLGTDHFAAFLEPCHGNPLARMCSSKSQSHEAITSSALLHT
ncbi:hypothetical protein SPRG_15771 [Saprolegnia parasitica CBS 223.65]|uniref:Uncharacterized protein n=1 Tax=Saprolegnia parasitica (strain CBS 223.65) TaxID=695850 RepID=A0A067BKC8_SAPPC|nr:hypothetical protein SPRG_15771 [Saprolegnia parasitica CBS 223.65]KDO18929.1 hypothetical protein SPRG_15771 [Saprolegnia parasitica CBS 223.65]|eukprot:XP_012210373.1 hypothetical protein SPRG_15771 [Saprolegnia parasitica CBS 223.65]